MREGEAAVTGQHCAGLGCTGQRGGAESCRQKLQAGSSSSSEASQHKLLNFMLWPDNAGAGEETEGERGSQAGRQAERVWHADSSNTHTHTHKQADRQTDSDAHASQALRKSVAANVDCSVGVGSAVTLIASVAAPRTPPPLLLLLLPATASYVMLRRRERERERCCCPESFAANLLSMR